MLHWNFYPHWTIISSLASGSFFKLAPQSIWHGFSSLWDLPCYCMARYPMSSSWYFQFTVRLYCYYLTSQGPENGSIRPSPLLFTLSCTVHITVSAKSPILPPPTWFQKLKSCLHIPLHFLQLYFISIFRHIFNTQYILSNPPCGLRFTSK